MNEPRQTLPGQGHSPQQPHQPQLRPPAGVPRPQGGVQPLPQRPVPVMPAGPGAAPPPPLPARRPAEDDGPIDLIDLEDEASTDGPAAGGAAGAPGATKPHITHATPLGGAGAATVTGISPGSKIKISAGGDKHTYNKFKRPVSASTGHGATRVRTFHGRLSDDGLAYTDDKINEWLDSHPEIEVKHVNCFVGPLEGKVTGEQGLIVVIWY
ncbi:MAG TPA: hypothetical protein VFB66_14905 [Tepidisphaeraceae bacterium]|nr:hypothetical protein [Tepidisphaeraceae bacterium]